MSVRAADFEPLKFEVPDFQFHFHSYSSTAHSCQFVSKKSFLLNVSHLAFEDVLSIWYFLKVVMLESENQKKEVPQENIFEISW